MAQNWMYSLSDGKLLDVSQKLRDYFIFQLSMMWSCFLSRVSLCSPGYSQSHDNSPFSTSQVLGSHLALM